MRPSASLRWPSGCDRVGVRVVPVEQAVLEAAEAEEVVLLLDVLDRAAVDRAQVAVDELVLGVVRLAARRSTGPRRCRARCRRCRSTRWSSSCTPAWWRGSVVRMKSSLEMSSSFHASAERGRDRVGLLLRATPGGLGRLLDLEAVLVGAGEEEDVVAEQAVPAGERVGDDGGVGVAEVGHVVDVVDRRRRRRTGSLSTWRRYRVRRPVRIRRVRTAFVTSLG